MPVGNNYHNLTDDNFQMEVIESERPVLVNFWAGWCGTCHVIEQTIIELAEDYDGRAKIGKLDVDSNPYVTLEYRIQTFPAVLFFKNGQVVDQIFGIASKEEFNNKISALL